MTEIAVWRGWRIGIVGFWHHGILCPDGSVIHYATRSGASKIEKKQFRILRTSLKRFKGGAETVYEVKHDHTFSPEEIVRRAESQLGERGYNLIFNNCEHFTVWCSTGMAVSRQILGGALSSRDPYHTILAIRRLVFLEIPRPTIGHLFRRSTLPSSHHAFHNRGKVRRRDL